MIVRTDHVAGVFFILFGIMVFAISGDLPVGSLAFPGAGMMPKLVTALMMFFGFVIILRGRESAPLASIAWGDLEHAAPVVIVASAAIALYQPAGFLATMTFLLFVLVAGLERRNMIYAAIYAVGVVLFAYVLFGRVLKTPLERGIFGF